GNSLFTGGKRKISVDPSQIEEDGIDPTRRRIEHEISMDKSKNRYSPDDLGPDFVVVVRSNDGLNIGRLHPTATTRIISENHRGYSHAKTTGANRMAIYFNTPEAANKFLDSNTCKNNNWSAEIPITRITRIGVIDNLDEVFTQEEFMEAAESNIKIVSAETLSKREGENWISSNSWKIYFSGQRLPKYISLYGLRTPVREYVQTVKRCRKCARFGHNSNDCKGTRPRCAKCGDNSHTLDNCVPSKQRYCIYCKTSEHSSEDKEICPKWKSEREIRKKMARKNISYAQAARSSHQRPAPQTWSPHREQFPRLPKQNLQDKPTKNPTSPPRKQGEKIPISSEMFEGFLKVFSNLIEQVVTLATSASDNRTTQQVVEQEMLKVFTTELEYDVQPETIDIESQEQMDCFEAPPEPQKSAQPPTDPSNSKQGPPRPKARSSIPQNRDSKTKGKKPAQGNQELKHDKPNSHIIQESQMFFLNHKKMGQYWIFNGLPPLGGRGNTICVHTSVKFETISIDLPDDIGIELTGVKILKEDNPLYIYSIYVIPSRTTTPQSWSLVSNSIKQPMIIGGDFNAHHLHWGEPRNDPRGTQVFDWITLNDLTLLNKGQATRLGRNNQRNTVIDLALSSPTISLATEWELMEDSMGSDHIPALITIQMGRGISPLKKFFTTRKWKIEERDWEKYQEEIRNHGNQLWKKQINLAAYNELVALMTTGMDKASKKRKAISTGAKHAPKPWWNQACQEAVEKRRLALRELTRHRSPENLEALDAIKKETKTHQHNKK
ncbi:uncharacterized protein LOC117639751, partial [Thrips palmi]|uniref:Uncharacterized protein LOC117639751 n=1 Tax=Thrips palmi TaxID=161013 RepID=A0A6P8YCL2_THRPL